MSVATSYSSQDGAFSAELDDGRFVHLRFPVDAVEGTDVAALEADLVTFLNAALAAHIESTLEAFFPADPLSAAISSIATDAVAQARLTLGKEQPLTPPELAQPMGAKVVVTWRGGMLVALRIGHELVRQGNARIIAEAVVDAVNATPSDAALPPQSPPISQDSESLRAEMKAIRDRFEGLR